MTVYDVERMLERQLERLPEIEHVQAMVFEVFYVGPTHLTTHVKKCRIYKMRRPYDYIDSVIIEFRKEMQGLRYFKELVVVLHPTDIEVTVIGLKDIEYFRKQKAKAILKEMERYND